MTKNPPGAENAVRRRPRERRHKGALRAPKTPSGKRLRRSARGLRPKVSERRGFLGKFFVKFWANFCTLPREKIFVRARRERARRGAFFAKFRENFRAKFSRFSRENRRAPRDFFFRARARARRPKTPARRRLSRAKILKFNFKNLILKDSRVKARLMKTKAYLRNLKPISYGLCINIQNHSLTGYGQSLNFLKFFLKKFKKI